jgi:hypothetical protein
MSQTGSPVPHAFYPFTIGQMLDRIFRLFRGEFWLFLRIGGVLIAGLVLVYGVFGAAIFASGVFHSPNHQMDPLKVMAVVLPAGFVAGLAFMLVYAIFEAAGIYAGLQASAGTRVTFREAYGVALKNAGRYVWLMILRNLAIGLPVLLCYALIAGLALWLFPRGAAVPTGLFFALPFFVLLYLGAISFMILMGLRLCLALPACIAEDLGAVAALKHSFRLTRNAMGRIFVVLLVVYAAGYAAFLVFQAACFAVIGVGALLFSGMHMQSLAFRVAFGVLGGILGGAMFLWMALLADSYAIAFAVLYHDQRLRMAGVAPLAPTGEPA